MRKALPILVAIVALLVVPLAHADGDPASDWLLTRPSFVPPDDGVPSAYSAQLQQVLADAKARGYEIRVAVLGTRYDMGSVYVLWLKPKPYAPFLSQELSFVYRGRVLVVMPTGMAIAKNGKAIPADQAVLDRLPKAGETGAALTSAATRAVVKLAANHGVVVTVPKLGAKTSTGPSENHDRATIGAAVLVVLALLGVAAFWRRRRRRR